jgi:predicted unusual protein kinase regulating ubiquinone biosynthesis (AarF/ABC1/UbiB family)
MLKNRYRRITIFFARILVSFAFWDILLPYLGMRRLSEGTRQERFRKAAVSFRRLAVDIGGVMIKVGQFLSSRLDILPSVITDELSGLQDEVVEEPFSSMKVVLEQELGNIIDGFIAFEEKAVASASIGQVYKATIKKRNSDSEIPEPPYHVVVKIQRPNIEMIVATDLAALRTVGGWIYRYNPIRRRANIPLLIEEFSKTTLSEIDYLAEGKNAETFASNFEVDEKICVPQVIWAYTTRRVLTLEDVQAIKITDYKAIESAGIKRVDVANKLFSTYLKQIFEDGFFHADPHPGNLFVTPDHTGETLESISHENWKLTFVDFGMVGRVPPNLRENLREVLIAVGTRDARRLVKSYQSLDILLPEADLVLLEKASAKVFEQFWGRSTAELTKLSHRDAVEFASEFRELMYALPFQVPEDLIMMVRMLGILSGICTGLDPDFNLWTNIAPYAQKLVSDEATPGLKVWITELGNILSATIALPKKADAVLGKMERGDLAIKIPQLEHQITNLDIRLQQISASIIFTGSILSAVQLYSSGNLIYSGILGFIAGVSLIWLITRRTRS